MKQRKEHADKAAIYDEFSEYVENELRSDENPHITLREFDLMAKSGATHMELFLENVKTLTGDLYDKVKAFKPGAFLKTKENVKDGAPQPVAFIPFRGSDRRGTLERSSSKSSSKSSQPNQTRLMLYVVALFSVIIIGLVKTTSADFRYFVR